MNDKRIIPQIEKNYIDTLYLACNLQDFIDDDAQHATLKYYNAYKYLADTMLVDAKCLGTADGYEWYELPNYRLGVMGYDEALKANWSNCVIQYEHSHIFPLNQDLDGLDLPFDGTFSQYQIKRIDITKTAKLATDYTINHGYLSSYRGHPLRPNRKEETVYLGSRTNGNVFRMYPKTLELLANKDFKKIALYSEYFGDIEDLYTFELELHRKYLKPTLGIDTLADLSKVWEANRNIVGRIRFFKDTPKNRKLLEQKHPDRIKALVLTGYVDYERVEKKQYKPSFSYLINKMKKDALRYVDSMELKRTNDNLMPIINALISELIDNDNKDMVMSFEDTILSDEMGKMSTKHKLMRDNQSNELELEAIRAFKKIEISHINSPVQDTLCPQDEVRKKPAPALPIFSERV